MLRRKDVWILLTMVGIPSLYILGIFFNSSVIVTTGDKKYAMSFFVIMFDFVNMIFIYFFILSFIAARSLGGEIENKSILLYTQRINDRKKMYKAKVLSVVTVFNLVCVVFFLFTMIMFYLFGIHREDVISSEFIRKDELLVLLLWFLSIYLLYIFTIYFSTMLSSFFKSHMVVIIFSIVFIIFIYLSKFPLVKYFSFYYYVSELGEIDFTHTSKAITLLLANLAIIFIYSFICNFIGIKQFERRDL